ncbi:hypothetical protein LMG18090_04059 [Ralstonia mannitolilytica]|uniref:hypothetical protein n=1 Tax=Ralstonia mannitolilytica TaxID=105219 RepID=UPI0028F4E41B|nr:hypothetical protein [Ralstonia mannitolilytica]CAJ0800878.1 hypothetical protein LMG18090_04059 [Ralstonia mannitolilytica]
MADENTIAARLGFGVLVGGLISLRYLPGNRWQRAGSFFLSVALGTIIGMAAIEFFKIDRSSWTAVLAVATATAFGFAVAINAMQQIPDILAALRRRFIGS